MTSLETFFLVSAIVGGLALFIFGMQLMTDGLCRVSGGGLRTILSRATRSRLAGISFGTVVGALVHSSAATVMLVGFVNAGLIRLEQSAAVIFGANIGTTLSMQAISFKLDDYCWFAIGFGFLLRTVAAGRRAAHFGSALLGFGMLFLGMSTMSDAIYPHRELLAPYLSHIDGSTLAGCVTGVLISAALTAIWQSSGATVAFCFALISAGVFTRLEQTLPIVLGAHIGTCATALLGSIGTHIDARRCAFAHLLFNIVNVTLAITFRATLLEWIPFSGDLVHQTANLHTVVMIVAGFSLLPIAPFFAKATRWLIPSRTAPPAPSHLDEALLKTPERALAAVILEVQRVAQLAADSFRLNARVMVFQYSRKTVLRIRRNEKTIDEIKVAIRQYLSQLTDRYLSRRQTLLATHLDRCIVDVERIGDHIETICDLSLKRKDIPAAMVDSHSWETLADLYQKASRVLDLVVASLDPGKQDFQTVAQDVLDARDQYIDSSANLREAFLKKVESKAVNPIASLLFVQYIDAFDRIVKHGKSIALAEKSPDFWIKRRKLDRVVDAQANVVFHERGEAQHFLDRLQEDTLL